MDYSPTLNLPRTDFPMRANLPQREPEFLERWERLDVYGRLRQLRQGRPKYVLHDGPPYANGSIHIGTAMNKTLKDIIVRYKSLRGYDAPYVPGWDTHGLPIEVRALADLNIDRKSVDVLELRAACREYALRWVDVQRQSFKRLGVLGDWERPYLTLEPAYEAAQVRVFGEMARQGHIYRDLYPVYWCPTCETALAEAEIEFRDKRSPSIYVAFPVLDGKGRLPADAAVVIWTTTPWTLPANAAVALHPEASYVLVDTPRGKLVVAEALQETLLARLGLEARGISGRFTGRELEGVRLRHPWIERESLVILGEHVSVDEGTGAVHTAPGHGQEDFEAGRRYGLKVIQPLDDRGRFTEEAGPFAGQFYADANDAICDELARRGLLLDRQEISHQYAHCWRCRNPVVWRATQQWFASVEGFRDAALAAIDQVRWVPAWGRDRIGNMVAQRADWCISRQRHWGVPLPLFYCRQCGRPLLTEASIDAVARLFEREGSDAWWRYEPSAILPRGTTCGHCGHGEFRREDDTMDVWFDSGSSHAAVLEHRPELRWPADLYLEGSDQHRGWFQSSLLTSVATRGRAPYDGVLTHGFVVDGEGRAMSKSLGNVVSPEEVIDQYGADVLRLWVAMVDYRSDVPLSPEIVKQTAEVYRKIRNTLRFLLANLSDYDPQADAVPYGRLRELDRWALMRLAQVVDRVTTAYDNFEYHLVYQTIHNFCTIDLSAFYLDVSKDRLYAEPAASEERRAAQTALHALAVTLVRLLAPILPFTAEDVWQHLPGAARMAESVHLTLWPEVPGEWRSADLARTWDVLLRVRDDVARAVEAARSGGWVRDTTAAAVTLHAGDAEVQSLLRGCQDQLPTVFRVAEVLVSEEPPAGASAGRDVTSLRVAVRASSYAKCARCWRHVVDVGTDDRYPDLCARCAGVVHRL
ncbi:MAG TPA: isoleucine--tRNA ligase [Bacillota bacterium]